MATQLASSVAVPSREAVEDLKRSWRSDPCFDLEDCEGFESYRDELLAYRQAQEARWALDAQQRLADYAARLGTDNLTLAAYVQQLEWRIARLERREAEA